MAETEQLFTVREIADEYRVSEETVRRWVKRGDIAYTAVGPFRLKRIKMADVAKEVKSGRIGDSVSGGRKN
jgi:excisionase family DNA binding protein